VIPIRTRAADPTTTADSGQGYTERGDAHEAIERIKHHAPAAEVTES
jgi:uncharacterized protein YegP (UPF0339 family)